MASESANSEGAERAASLRARRTQTSSERVSLTVGAGIRRTPGLRREELATLAGISIDYCVRLEHGKETRASPAVLDSLARALHIGPAGPGRSSRRTAPGRRPVRGRHRRVLSDTLGMAHRHVRASGSGRPGAG